MRDIRQRQDRLARHHPFAAVEIDLADHAGERRADGQLVQGGLGGGQLVLGVRPARFGQPQLIRVRTGAQHLVIVAGFIQLRLGHFQVVFVLQAAHSGVVVGLGLVQRLFQVLAGLVAGGLVFIRLEGQAGLVQELFHLTDSRHGIQVRLVGGYGEVVQHILGVFHRLLVGDHVLHGLQAGRLGGGGQVRQRLLRLHQLVPGGADGGLQALLAFQLRQRLAGLHRIAHRHRHALTLPDRVEASWASWAGSTVPEAVTPPLSAWGAAGEAEPLSSTTVGRAVRGSLARIRYSQPGQTAATS